MLPWYQWPSINENEFSFHLKVASLVSVTQRDAASLAERRILQQEEVKPHCIHISYLSISWKPFEGSFQLFRELALVTFRPLWQIWGEGDRGEEEGTPDQELNLSTGADLLASRSNTHKNFESYNLEFQAAPGPVTALASFPGSGNTWLRYLLQQVSHLPST